MSYFPMLYKLDDKKILIVGGGKIAHDKLEKVLILTKSVEIVARELSDKMQETAKKHNLKTSTKAYDTSDIAGFDVVIAAVDDIELQSSIYSDCQKAKILCNSVDATDYCDFIFPSFFKKNELIVAVSSSGITPSLAKGLREHFESQIPDQIDQFIEKVAGIRASMPKGKERQKLLIDLSKEFIKTHLKSH